MIQSRLKTVIICKLCFFALIFPGLLLPSVLLGDTLTPDRNISMVRGEPDSPEWKILWDKARNYSREENYSLAVQAYRDLFAIKSNIEEANWEYCKVLLQVEDYSLAGRIIGGLLERDPSNNEYLLAAGTIAAEGKNYDEAIRYYGRVLEKSPAGPGSDTALLGLANSLRNQEKKQFSFSLLEQYYLRHPEDQQVLEHLALDALELGRAAKAREFFSLLLENSPVEDRIIFQAATAFDQPGFEKKRNSLWLKYLENHPDYLPFRKKITYYFLASQNFEQALVHLSHLADKVEDNGQYLLQAADLCLYELDRADKALNFLERYRSKHPDSLIINKKIGDVQTALARSFLVIVENDRALQLWRDLAKVTVNRQAVYLKIADILEEKGQVEVLIQVLEIVYKHGAANNELALRLAKLYRSLGAFDQALVYLKEIQGGQSRKKSFLLLRGDTELQLGLEMDALVSFERALKVDPGDTLLRDRCLRFAGGIGNTVKMKSFFEGGLRLGQNNISFDFVFNYLRLLRFNYLFQEYEETYRIAKEQFLQSPERLRQLDIDRTTVVRKKGDVRQAEQLLRQLLHDPSAREVVLDRLFDNSLKDKDLEGAESWYMALLNQTCSESSGASCFYSVSGGCRLLLLKTRLLKEKGKFAAALSLIDNYFAAVKAVATVAGSTTDLLSLKKMRCWLSYYREKYNDAYSQFTELQTELNAAGSKQFDPEMWILAEKLKVHLPAKQQNRLTNIVNSLVVANRPVLSHLLLLAGAEIDSREYRAAQKHVETVLESFPGSVVARNLWVESMVGQGKGGRSLETLSRLLEQFPGENFFIDKRIDIETRRGGYKEGLIMLSRKVGEEDVDQTIARLSSTGDQQELLRLARLLWGDKQQKRALDIYQQLLENPVLDQVSQEFKQENLEPPYNTQDKTFWNSILLMLQSEPKVLDELMAPPFLLDNLGNKTGEIVAGYFARYSWQRLISNEYSARKAIYDRNYYYAEQSYKRLMEEDPHEGMFDLAAIYGKIGKYRKEAQLYQAIKESGASSPGLSESIERNSLQLSPQNIFHASYWEQEGREGNIDMAKLSLGTSFEFTPDLNMDFRFIYANNYFESLDSESKAKSDFIYGLVTYEFTKGYELILGAGVEKLSGDMDSGYQYKLELTGQLDDYLDAYLLLEKKQVYDTIPAIEEQVTYQVIEAGINFETPIGLAFGGDLQHRYYNDSNSQNRFHGYSSYTVFGESLRLAMRYDYQYLISEDDNGPQKPQIADNSEDRVLYWSPSSLSEHRLGLSFQQDFLGFEVGSKKNMSYWAVDSGIGLEDNENLIFTTKLDIFLEMSPHFLLKGNFTLSTSDDYEEKGVSLSLNYRW